MLVPRANHMQQAAASIVLARLMRPPDDGSELRVAAMSAWWHFERSFIAAVGCEPREREWFIRQRSRHWAQLMFASSRLFINSNSKEVFRMSASTFYTLANMLPPPL